MEVAVIQSLRRPLCLATPALFIGLILTAGGCTEVMTNTRVDREHAIKMYNDGNYADAAGALREGVRKVGTRFYVQPDCREMLRP